MTNQKLTGEQIKDLLIMSLSANCNNLSNFEIKAETDSVYIYAPQGKDTVYSVNNIFIFAESLNISAYIGVQYQPYCRPYICLIG